MLAAAVPDGDLDIFSWTETVSNLGWTADETVYMHVFRQATEVGDTLTGDWNWHLFSIKIPLN